MDAVIANNDKQTTAPAADLARRSVSALLWNIAGGSGKAAAQLLIQIALARMLGPEAFGQYSAILIVLGIGWLLADAGFGAALVQKQTIDDADVGQALGWVLLVASIMSATVAYGAPFLAGQFADPALTPMFRAVSVLIFLVALSNISTNLLRRDLDMKRLQIIQIVSYLVGFGLVAMVLAANGFGAWSLVIGFGVQTALTCGASFAITRHSLRPRLDGDRSMRTYGLKVVLTNIANWAIENLDRFLVGRLWGVPALGFYSVAFNLSRAPVGMLTSSMQAVAFSSAARIQDDDARTRRSYLALLSVLALAMFPAFALICIEADYVMHIVYGSKWIDATPLLAAFAVATPLYALTAVTGPLLWARNAVEKELYSQIIVAVILLGGFVLLRHTLLTQAVWIVPAAYLCRFAFLYLSLHRLLCMKSGDLLRALSGGLLVAAIAIAVDAMLRRPTALGFDFWINTMPIAAAVIVTMLAVRLAGKWLINAELCSILQARRGESGTVNMLCRLLRMPVMPA